MINRSHRFHGLGSLNFVYRRGKTARGTFFSTRAAFNSQRSSYRVAVVISKKVHKSAVARNRIRRRLYAAIRALDTNITGPYDIVITVFNAGLLNEPAQAIEARLVKQFKLLGIIAERRSS